MASEPNAVAETSTASTTAYGLFIDNRFRDAITGRTLGVVDPSDGSIFATIPRGDTDDIAVAVASARQAFDGAGTADGVWGRSTALERSRLLRKLADVVLAHVPELGALEARDTGKPLRQGIADATALARYFEFYAGAADKLHGQTLPYQQGYTVMTIREPHGVTGHIIPWNYPMQIFGRSVGAALAAGNACVVKPAEDACLSLLRIGEMAASCGFPPGALSIVTGLGTEAGAALASHPGIDHISFTGSPQTGEHVASMAARHHCPVTLELGGKSPQLVFDDADLDNALPVLVNAIIQNAGQTCSAGSRLLVQRAIAPMIQERLSEIFAGLRAAPAMQDADLGPLISRRQQQRVWDCLSEAQSTGVRVLAQGQIDPLAPAGGFYQVPVLLGEVPNGHRIEQEEIFGPVLALDIFDDESQAQRKANATPYGLVAGIWTRDGARQLRLARRLRAGQVFINNYGAGGGVELPFGGVGRSGYGREKGFEALYGFTALKTIAIRHD
ncbi:MAG: aldehyde dehydrogenase family protein [Burkholderiaceae bacterium]|nr:aldehyde dehydrogenase family protein [Burkholderiaceae bacterium]